jgi:hypothetical protein
MGLREIGANLHQHEDFFFGLTIAKTSAMLNWKGSHMRPILNLLAPLTSLALLASCYGSNNNEAGSSRLSTISIGNLKNADGLKPWSSGRIQFKKSADQTVVIDEAFNANKDGSASKIELKIPKGMYTLSLVYFGEAKDKPLYKNCLDDNKKDKVYPISDDEEKLTVEICDGDNNIIGVTDARDSNVTIEPEIKKGPASGSSDTSNQLIGLWTQCSTEGLDATEAPLAAHLTSFMIDGSTFKAEVKGFKDKECKTPLVQADVDAYQPAGEFKSYLQETVTGIKSSFKYTLGKVDANGIATLDLLSDELSVAPIYLNVKFQGDLIFLSKTCDEDDVKSNVCKAVNSNRADNRATEFETEGYTKVKK